jgi:hypothetical protein
LRERCALAQKGCERKGSMDAFVKKTTWEMRGR